MVFHNHLAGSCSHCPENRPGKGDMGMGKLDRLMDARAAKEKEQTLVAVYGGLEAAVGGAGGEMLGFSVKLDGLGCLLILKAHFPAGTMVGFVGAETIDGCLRKATWEAARDLIKWREDKWRGNGGWPASRNEE